MFEMLKKLVEASSASGYEEGVRGIMTKELKKITDEVKVDNIGNIIAKKGTGSPKVMLAAHMDEIGLIVKYVNKEGFIIFDKLGGWDDRILPSQKVVIHGSKGKVTGVIGCKPPHIQEKEDQGKVIKVKEMFIDIGAKREDDVKKAGVNIGDFVTIKTDVEKLLGTRVTGHAFDNRIGCLVMIETAKRLKKFKGTVYFVGTVKEEIGMIGVRGSAFSVNPDVMVALDTGIAGDTPGIQESEVPTKMNAGPSLDIKDSISVISPKVKKWVKDSADALKVKLQFDIMTGSATDASIVPTIREGIPAGALTVPTRYVHTPVEVADMNDVEDCVKLCVKMVENAHAYF